jgi:hypothetical protein
MKSPNNTITPCQIRLNEEELKGILWPHIAEYISKFETWSKKSEQKSIFYSLITIPISLILSLFTSDFDKFGSYKIIVIGVLIVFLGYSIILIAQIILSLTDNLNIKSLSEITPPKPQEKKLIEKIIKEIKKVRPEPELTYDEDYRTMVKQYENVSIRKETEKTRRKYFRPRLRRKNNLSDDF